MHFGSASDDDSVAHFVLMVEELHQATVLMGNDLEGQWLMQDALGGIRKLLQE